MTHINIKCMLFHGLKALSYKTFEIYEIMKMDKKNRQQKIKMSLVKDIGQSSFDHEISKEMIMESFRFYQQMEKND